MAKVHEFRIKIAITTKPNIERKLTVSEYIGAMLVCHDAVKIDDGTGKHYPVDEEGDYPAEHYSHVDYFIDERTNAGLSNDNRTVNFAIDIFSKSSLAAFIKKFESIGKRLLAEHPDKITKIAGSFLQLDRAWDKVITVKHK